VNDRRVIWERQTPDGRTACVMISCCAGAELQVVRIQGTDEEILLRELYPDRSSLYERARELDRNAIERLPDR
jgi:hypothetical protein